MSDHRNSVHSVSLDEITLDTRLQFRRGRGPWGCDMDVIERYADDLKDKATFPPLELIELTESHEEYDAGTLLLVSGFTRYCAAKSAGLSAFQCLCRPGTWADARCLAFKQNSNHGKPRNKTEIAAVIEAVSRDYPGKSMREIARMAACSHGMVHKIIGDSKPKPEPQPEPPPREEKQKLSTTIPTPKAGKPAAEPARTDEEPEEEEDDPAPEFPLGDEEVTVNWGSKGAPEEEETIDQFEGLRQDRRFANAIASDLKTALKNINDLKARPGGARIKFGVCEKGLEEVRRHLQNFCPAFAMTDAAKDLNHGQDFTDGLGWVHAIASDRLGTDIKEECVKL